MDFYSYNRDKRNVHIEIAEKQNPNEYDTYVSVRFGCGSTVEEPIEYLPYTILEDALIQSKDGTPWCSPGAGATIVVEYDNSSGNLHSMSSHSFSYNPNRGFTIDDNRVLVPGQPIETGDPGNAGFVVTLIED
jgi:hypothetical protein